MSTILASDRTRSRLDLNLGWKKSGRYKLVHAMILGRIALHLYGKTAPRVFLSTRLVAPAATAMRIHQKNSHKIPPPLVPKFASASTSFHHPGGLSEGLAVHPEVPWPIPGAVIHRKNVVASPARTRSGETQTPFLLWRHAPGIRQGPEGANG